MSHTVTQQARRYDHLYDPMYTSSEQHGAGAGGGARADTGAVSGGNRYKYFRRPAVPFMHNVPPEVLLAPTSGEPAAAHVPKRRNSYQAPEVSLPAHAGGGTNPFPGHLVGCYSNHGMKPGPTGRAAAKINQDRGVAIWPFLDDEKVGLFVIQTVSENRDHVHTH